MSRGIKYVLYGFLFLFVLSFIIAAVYLLFFKAKINCEDGILNQGEEKVDCGGPCIACEIKDFELIKSKVEIISISETKSTLVATITNVNRNYGATGVNYSLSLINLVGDRLNLIEGETALPPETTRYIIEPGLSINSLDISRIEFEVEKSPSLLSKEDWVRHEVTIKQAKPVFSEGTMKIEGIVANSTGNDINTLKLSALVRDSQGRLVSAAITVVDKLLAFKGKGFVIFVPISSNISADELETEILWEAVS